VLGHGPIPAQRYPPVRFFLLLILPLKVSCMELGYQQQTCFCCVCGRDCVIVGGASSAYFESRLLCHWCCVILLRLTPYFQMIHERQTGQRWALYCSCPTYSKYSHVRLVPLTQRSKRRHTGSHTIPSIYMSSLTLPADGGITGGSFDQSETGSSHRVTFKFSIRDGHSFVGSISSMRRRKRQRAQAPRHRCDIEEGVLP
jgi:hypothetical protein